MHSASEGITKCQVIYLRVLIPSGNLVQAFISQGFGLQTSAGIKKIETLGNQFRIMLYR